MFSPVTFGFFRWMIEGAVRPDRLLLIGLSLAMEIAPVWAGPIEGDSLLNTLVTCAGNCEITGGIQQGSNLFHGFNKLTVDRPVQANIQVPISVQRVFARVKSETDIQGTFGININTSSHPVDLVLLSPQGIKLGREASLEIPGAFLGTTADRLVFGNGLQFGFDNQRNPIGSPTSGLLTQVVMGTSPGSIVLNQYMGFYQSNASFALLGGDITLNGNSASILYPWQEGLYLKGYGSGTTVDAIRNVSGDGRGAWTFQTPIGFENNSRLKIDHYEIQELVGYPSSIIDFSAGLVELKNSTILINASQPQSMTLAANSYLSGNQLVLKNSEVQGVSNLNSGSISLDFNTSINLENSIINLSLVSPDFDYQLSFRTPEINPVSIRSITRTYQSAVDLPPSDSILPIDPGELILDPLTLIEESVIIPGGSIVSSGQSLVRLPIGPNQTDSLMNTVTRESGELTPLRIGDVMTLSLVADSAIVESSVARTDSKQVMSRPKFSGNNGQSRELIVVPRCHPDRTQLLRRRGREGLLSSPSEAWGGPVFIDYGDLENRHSRPVAVGGALPLALRDENSPISQAILEAQNWQRDDRGQIQLLATQLVSPTWSHLLAPTCGLDSSSPRDVRSVQSRPNRPETADNVASIDQP
jgi:filamentous hemagglutinin family protein